LGFPFFICRGASQVVEGGGGVIKTLPPKAEVLEPVMGLVVVVVVQALTCCRCEHDKKRATRDIHRREEEQERIILDIL
jgi:hypothetical protein